MIHLNSFLNFLSERRNIESRIKVTVANRIYNFLKESKYQYKPGSDSNVFTSFKTGDFETIIPSRDLGGKQYTSPQGFYCFDMNGFKERLFGEEEISPDTFNPDNLKKSSDTIRDLGLGYGNNGNVVDNENIWDEFGGIPRYLYFVRVKPGSLILSSNSTSLKFYDPLVKLIRFYSHNYLIDSKPEVFSPKDKKDIGQKSIKEYKQYFEENKDKYIESFVNRLMKLINSIGKDEKDLHIKMYNFILSCSSLIKEEKKYVRFNIICKSIGIDGFTQRRKDVGFIHSSPEFQTLLLTESCVDELMKIDLVKELKNDRYVTGEKTKLNLDSFLANIKPGDILLDKNSSKFYRFDNIDNFKERFGKSRNVKSTFKVELDKLIKVDLTTSKSWKFIQKLKEGDYLKITTETEDKGEQDCIIIQIEKAQVVNDSQIDFDFQKRRFIEKFSWNGYTNFYIDGKSKNISYPYNLKKPDKETPLFDPAKVNGSAYVYWIQNKEELEKQGATWDTFIDEYEKKKILYKLDDLFTNREYKTDLNNFRLYDDLDLLSLITSFKNNYYVQVFNTSGSFMKKNMTLYLYRGDLSKPLEVHYSGNEF
jgi:hypothetical protein